ncbi:hypothetical protein NQ318_012838 [Aromia moschata]|uniref:RIB43A-like with coiled-coils protein 2 n=1 Tax=Aromia moschata TaxID=1265417 RepID=A0AAV8XNX7_9CUCU|nr:hypothetical protein NQ318_012838 [Aromia moschata]
MLNFQLMTDRDRREAASLEQRRQFEEERKKRIFNPRQRLIGVDINILERQIEEKRQRDLEEKSVERIFEEQRIKDDEVALALERKEQEERNKIVQEINIYRKKFPEKQIPPRLYDEDPRLGMSSCQKFEGEDLQNEQRSKIQREEIKAWLDQQVMEKNNDEQKEAEEAYKAAVIARDMRALELDRMEKECRRKLQEACVRFNKALADEKLCERQKREKQEINDNMAEIYNNLTSDMLTENPAVAEGNLGKKIGYLYKGMTPEEKKKFVAEQQAQIEEAKKKKLLEERREREMDDYMNGIQKTVCLMDRELAEQQKKRNKELAEENQRLAVEQNNRKRYLEKEVFKGTTSDLFFEQFNKSTR